MSESFTSVLQANAEFESEQQAGEVAAATLEQFGRALSRGETEDLASDLPEEWAEPISEPARRIAEPVERQEFVEEIAREVGLDVQDVPDAVQAVCMATAAEVGTEEIENAQAQFPPEYELFFEPATALVGRSFVDAVAEHGGIESNNLARRATRATLETLSERLSRGEADDLVAYLPEEPTEWLHEDAGEAVGLSREEFLERVVDRGDLPREQAEEHVSAVFAALESTVGDTEFEQAMAQLPAEYGALTSS